MNEEKQDLMLGFAPFWSSFLFSFAKAAQNFCTTTQRPLPDFRSAGEVERRLEKSNVSPYDLFVSTNITMSHPFWL